MKKNPYLRLWIGLGILAMLSPIGLILPEIFKAGAAWGEWSPEQLEKMLGFVPRELKRLSELWSAPLPDYTLKAWEGAGLAKSSLAYVLSAVLGVLAVVGAIWLIGRWITRREDS
jgi:hypothetical protein